MCGCGVAVHGCVAWVCAGVPGLRLTLPASHAQAAVTLNQATPTASSQVIKPWDVIVSMMHEPVPGAAHGAWGGAGAVVSVGGTDECVTCTAPRDVCTLPAPRRC